MKAKTLLITILFFLIFANISYSQITTKGWNVYTSLQNVNDIKSFNNIVYAATTGGLFSFDYSTPQSSIRKYTNIDGLLNNNLLSIAVDLNGNVWSGSNDGSINFFNPVSNIWRGVTDIQNSTETSKGINGIFQYGRYIFFATDFSITKFDANRFEFIDQPYIYLGPSLSPKTPVYKVYVLNDTIWAATKSGIAYANINNYLPIQSSWSDLTTNNSSLKSNMINTITYFNGSLYFGTDSGMYNNSQNILTPYLPTVNGVPFTGPVRALSASNNSLYFTSYKSSNNVYKVDLSNINNAQLIYSGYDVNTAIPGNNSDILVGTVNNGIDLYKDLTHNFIYPNGPFSNIIFDLKADGHGNVWETSGPEGNFWSNISGIYKFDGKTWKNYMAAKYPEMGTDGLGWMFLYPSRCSNIVWVGGLGNGLLKIDGDNVFRYSDANSIIGYAGTPGFDIVGGMDEDQNCKLWITNCLATDPNKQLINFTDSIAYKIPCVNVAVFFMHMVIDNYNTKWMVLHTQQGGLRGVIYYNEVVNSCYHLDYPDFGPDVHAVLDIMKDKDGQIWISTDNGIFIITDPYQVIQNPGSIPYIYKMRIIENGLSTPLTENVYSVQADAVNNKWIGTYSNGLLYVSSDGSTLLNRITKSTSPLIDNRIVYLAPDKVSGNSYIATQSGLCSYQTVAVQALTDCDKIKAGPNPFIIPNDNLLRISGLVEGSNVKILTISGKLILDFTSPGGQIANWDGRDKNGNLVASGIYIIVGYNQDGSKVCTGKVAVIRK